MADLLTFGCRLNAYESAVIASHAADLDAIVVNTCAVTHEAEQQARQAIRRAAREQPGRPIVVTGCAAQIVPAAWAALPGVVRVVGTAEKLDPAMWRAGAPSAVGDIRATRVAPAPAVSDFGGHARAFVAVQHGCDHQCTFCVIPQGRGPSRSVPVGGVVAQARAAIEAGFREVVLTGVDLTSYGHDLPGQPPLGQMVRRLLALLPELARLRLSSLDPAAIDADLWRLVAEEPRLMPHLHLSAQAGCDLILKRMRRRHLRADILAIATRARALRPGIAIGADLIAGFPTETDAMAEETRRLVENADFAFTHVFPYSPRPATPAARMPQVEVPVRRERAAALRATASARTGAFLRAQIGREAAVLIETGTRGHTEHFAPVLLDGPRKAIRRARIVDVSDGTLLAEAA